MVTRVSVPSRKCDEPKVGGRPDAVTAIERKIQALIGRNPIGIRELEQVDAPIAYVGHLQLAVPVEFPLHGQIPLPRVGKVRVGTDTVTRRSGSSQRTGRRGGIKRAGPAR